MPGGQQGIKENGGQQGLRKIDQEHLESEEGVGEGDGRRGFT